MLRSARTDAIEVDDDVDYGDPELTGYQTRLAALRDEKGVVRLRFGSTTGLVLLRHADVRNAFRDDTRFSKSEAVRRRRSRTWARTSRATTGTSTR